MFPASVGEYFGLKHHGTIFGSVLLFCCLGGAIGPFLAGHVYDVTGEYELAFVAVAIGALIGLLSILFLKAPKLAKDG